MSAQNVTVIRKPVKLTNVTGWSHNVCCHIGKHHIESPITILTTDFYSTDQEKNDRTSSWNWFTLPELLENNSFHEVGAEYPTIIYRKLKVKSEESKADEELDGESTTTQAAKSPQKRRPHARKAHWQHYWTGKGRSTLEVRWIPDLFVGANRDDQVVVVYDSEKGSLKGKRNPNTSKKKKS